MTIPRFVAEEAAHHLTEHPPADDGHVFTMPSGGPIQARNWTRRYWRPAVRAAGLVPFKLHDLLHTAVALAIASCAHPKSIQEMLGHRAITTTLDRYGHLFPPLHEDLADRLDAVGRRARAHNLHTDGDGDVVPIRVAEAESGR